MGMDSPFFWTIQGTLAYRIDHGVFKPGTCSMTSFQHTQIHTNTHRDTEMHVCSGLFLLSSSHAVARLQHWPEYF